MKKLILITLFSIMIFNFTGCEKKKVSHLTADTEAAQQVDFEDSNLVIEINRDIYKPMPVNMLVFIDEKLCLNSDELTDGMEIISANLKVENNKHIITVVIDGEVNSSVLIETTGEKQWVIIEYSYPGVMYNISNEIPLFD